MRGVMSIHLRLGDRELDLDPPPDWNGAAEGLRVWCIRPHPSEPVVAVDLASSQHAGFGLWDTRSGHFLRWLPQRSTGARWLNRGLSLLVAINEMGRAEDGGISHRLQRIAWPSSEILDDCQFGLPQCCIDDLVVSASERLALAWLNSGQGECGYVLLLIAGGLQCLNRGPIFSLNTMVSAPSFAPSEQFVISAAGTNEPLWWTDPNNHQRDWNTPAKGGLITFGQIFVHDLEADQITAHRIDFDLPSGWIPDDPDNGWWMAPRSPEYLSEDRIQFQLPDRSCVELDVPLPEAVVLAAPSPNCPD